MALSSAERSRQYRERHPERAKAAQQKYNEQNKEKRRLVWKAYDKKRVRPEGYNRRAYYAENKQDWRERYFKRVYGLTLEDYIILHKKQNGVCAICKEPERVGKSGRVYPLCVDHDHQTGKVRGLLCRACNGFLGFYEDAVRRSGAENYLAISRG